MLHPISLPNLHLYSHLGGGRPQGCDGRTLASLWQAWRGSGPAAGESPALYAALTAAALEVPLASAGDGGEPAAAVAEALAAAAAAGLCGGGAEDELLPETAPRKLWAKVDRKDTRSWVNIGY
jgi:hypothetical protein